MVVVNMGDTIACDTNDSGCPADGRFQFNTDVVFSEDGTVSYLTARIIGEQYIF